MTKVFDSRPCILGEGPLWHPERKDLFWFDIMARKLICRSHVWEFPEYVSAAGWISHNELLIASQSRLFTFHLETSAQKEVCPLEADNPITRSNDGRADPNGGFWIGTMGLSAEFEAGAIYRYYQGKLCKLFSNITIPNSICFSPHSNTAYFTDTATRKIMAVDLDQDGWPNTSPRIVIDLTSTGENPDGSVVDAHGNIWNAQWGASRVACYSPNGVFLHCIKLPARHATCPAFAGETGRLFCTSATEGLQAYDQTDADGQVFETQVATIGQLEHQIIL